MSTNVLSRAIGLAGYQHMSTLDEKGKFKLFMEPPASAVRCPGCHSTEVIRRGTSSLHTPIP